MKAIREIGQHELIWIQPRKHKRDFELRAGEETLATLRWEKQHKQMAAGEAADGRWTFRRLGFLHQHVEARESEADLEVARFQPLWRGGGTLEFPDGRRFGLRPTSFWNAEWAWTTATNDLLLRVKRTARSTPEKGHIDLLPGTRATPELSLLILLSWYLIILAADDAAAATLAASVAATAAV
ncbi:MAG TPA: hypothetical protein VKT82_03820 [Ktedonobacterales bacterium]|nr:hypothetical protein [Ktedonobacterales bacterium]